MNFFKSSEPSADPAAAAPAGAVVMPVGPKYPRAPFSKWAQALVWLNCASLVVCGILAFIFACIRPNRISHYFLSIYMAIFGVLCGMAELRLPVSERLFGILCTKNGLAYCFIFVGTLGISFWVGKYAGVLIPFISGIFSVVIGCLCVGDKLMGDRSVDSTRAAEVTVV